MSRSFAVDSIAGLCPNMAMKITRYWKVTGGDESRSFNLMQVKRRAALQVVRDFAYSEYTKRLSSISHTVIEANEYGVTGCSTMEVEN